QRWWQNLMLAMPLWFRQHIAAKARQKSARHKAGLQQNQPDNIMDVTPSEVVRVMQQAGVKHLIHGHTHRPAVHELTVAQHSAKRYVLGDWYQQSSYLYVSADDWRLYFNPLQQTKA
ncbi:MAG: UDP-2,3-diacylglucosamine hydrolase, partial [Alkalimonas sp.]|nr:UDP-2,3-diacylglucosamine hydrolase [Alkalimonas sp.]